MRPERKPPPEQDSATGSRFTTSRIRVRIAGETLPSTTEAAIHPSLSLFPVADGVAHGGLSLVGAPIAAEVLLEAPFDPLTWSTELHAGTRFGAGGRFELVRLLGSGGTGLVFLTRDLLLDRLVAAKFARPDGELPWDSMAARFAAEGRVTAKLNHENIVHVFDVGVWHEHPYLVLEYLEGSPLNEQLAAHRLSPRRATQIMMEIARALDHAHHAGILHLDLKPHNVFVLNNGHVKILDFGISALSSAQGDEGANEHGDTVPVGTPSYMAPEQWRMAALDERTDIWAAGVIYYEMLRGSAPFAAVDPTRLCASILSDMVAPPSSSRLGMPRIGERLIASMLSRNPAQRPRSAVELLLGLDSVQHAIRHRPGQMATKPAHVFAASIMRVWWSLRLALR